MPTRSRPLWLLASFVLCTGCQSYNRVKVQEFDDRPRQLVRKLVVVVSAGNDYGASPEQIRDSVRRAVARAPESVVIDFEPATKIPSGKVGRAAAARDEAITAARAQGADAACVVDVGECGWMFGILALPPGWSLNNRLAYSLRVFDAASGDLVMTSTRTRGNGGLFALHVPRLLPQIESGVRADLRPLLAGDRPKSSDP